MDLEAIVNKWLISVASDLPPWVLAILLVLVFVYGLLKWIAQAIAIRLLTENGDSETRLEMLRIWNEKPRTHLYEKLGQRLNSKKRSADRSPSEKKTHPYNGNL